MVYDVKGCSERIRQLRKNHGWTQVELAEKLEMSHSSIIKMENALQGISVDTLLMMKRLFHVSIDYILTGEKHDPKMAEGLQQIIDIATQLWYKQ